MAATRLAIRSAAASAYGRHLPEANQLPCRGEHGGHIRRGNGGIKPGFDLFEVGRRYLLDNGHRDRAKALGKQAL